MRLHKFFNLNSSEKKLFIEAVVTLYKIKILLQIIPFKKLRALCSIKESFISDHVFESSDIKDCRLAISRAGNITFWNRSICLVNALSLQQMLAKRGISSTLHLGAKKTGKNISAHAWLERDGIGLIGQQIKNDFTPIASFTSKKIEIENQV